MDGIGRPTDFLTNSRHRSPRRSRPWAGAAGGGTRLERGEETISDCGPMSGEPAWYTGLDTRQRVAFGGGRPAHQRGEAATRGMRSRDGPGSTRRDGDGPALGSRLVYSTM
jgi:hypothetical protein